MSGKKIIITADDYGMSKGVNQAIDAGIEYGLITSTNVMTNMDYYTEAEKLRDKNVSVGIHWTVSAGKPVCSPDEIKTLVDKEGNFYSYPEFRKRYREKMISDNDIAKELKAQYERFVKVCGEPDYWNTHQNTHVDFGVFKLFTDTAKELGIQKMRSHKRVYIPSSSGKSSMSLGWIAAEPIKRAILNSWIKYAEKNGMKSPYGVALALRKEDIKNPEYCFLNMKNINNAVTEYVIHPSTSLDSAFFGSIGEDRLREYKQFTSEQQKEILEKNNYILVNFSNI